MNLDHIDIVVTHQCNMNCKFCIDKFRGMDDKIVKLSDIEAFLSFIQMEHITRHRTMKLWMII